MTPKEIEENTKLWKDYNFALSKIMNSSSYFSEDDIVEEKEDNSDVEEIKTELDKMFNPKPE